MLVPGEVDRVGDLGVAYRQGFGGAVAQDAEGDRGHERRLERVAEGMGRVRFDRHDLASLKRALHVVPAVRLDDDDLRIRAGQRDSARQPASAARNDDPRWRTVQLLEDLEADRALPGNNVRIIEARNYGGTAFLGQLRGDRLAALGPAIVEDDLRA